MPPKKKVETPAPSGPLSQAEQTIADATAYEQAHIDQNAERIALRQSGVSSEDANEKLGRVQP